MARILLNLLAAVDGAQITRANAFVERFAELAPHSRLLILKDSAVLKSCEGREEWDVVNVQIGRGRFKAAYRMAWECLRLPGLMRAWKCDVYLTFSHFLPWLLPERVLAIVGVSNLAPFSKEAWNEETSLLPKMKLLFLRRSIISSGRRASRVIALSDAGREILERHGVDRTKIAVIPNGVERLDIHTVASAADVRRRYRIDGPYILYVSHFHRYKNFKRLIDAYSLLPANVQRDYRMVLVGKPYVQSYFDEVAQKIEALALVDRIVVVPGLSHAELHALYKGADLFVFPSLIENSPMILLEAMANGLPVVASRIAPMPEFAGEAALYFDPFRAEDCAQVMARALSDEALLSAMREKSLVRATRFSWDAFGARVIALCGGNSAAAQKQ